MNDDVFLHCLGKIPGVGAEKLRKIAEYFQTAEAAWLAPREELLLAGIPSRVAEAIAQGRKAISPDKEREDLERQEIRLVPRGSDDYPLLLAEIPNPPQLLYLRGIARPNRRPCITIVGTRKPTEYGIGIAREFARELSKAGVTVVSGMAFGIDKAAHQGALEGDGETIAVLGNGLDDVSVAPRTHLDLARSISLHGALLSDYPPGTGASEGTFPARNRIMAGMSLGTVVVEASEKSGTLITANLAIDFNREVFAVPGSIYSENSRGPHELIKKGAVLTASLSDILDALPLSRECEQRELSPEDAPSPEPDISDDEALLLKMLGSDTIHIDALIKRSGMGTSGALSAIAFLEMKGLVKNIGNMHYIRIYRMSSK